MRVARYFFKPAMALLLALGVPACMAAQSASGGTRVATANPVLAGATGWEFGAVMQGGFGVTEDRGDYRFLMAGVHAGRVLTGLHGRGMARGSFEYAVEIFPFWQSYTPISLRQNCTEVPGPFGGEEASCSVPFPVGGTYSGVSLTPIILRWDLAGTRRFAPWVQGAGGLIWTDHKYPGFGGPPVNATGGLSYSTIGDNGANDDTSVWNFTPQFGVGVHYFVRPRRSIDLGANAVHVSSASLGDKNPGINASVQFTLGYSWWK